MWPLVALAAAYWFVGDALAGRAGSFALLLVAAVTVVTSLRLGDEILIDYARARPLAAERRPQLAERARLVAEGLGLPAPRLFVAERVGPNAFSVGRDPQTTTIVLGPPLLDVLDDRELDAVIAHELAHVRARDGSLFAIGAALMAMLLSIPERLGYQLTFELKPSPIWILFFFFPFALFLVVPPATLIVAPFIAYGFQVVAAHAREREADLLALDAGGDPLALAAAIEKADAALPPGSLVRDLVLSSLSFVHPLDARLRGPRTVGSDAPRTSTRLRLDALRRSAGLANGTQTLGR